MSKLKLILLLIVAMATAAVGVWISSENNQLVQPVLFGWSFMELNLGTWLFLVFLVGGLLGFAISWLSYFRVNQQRKSLQRRLHRKEHEVAQLRSAALGE